MTVFSIIIPTRNRPALVKDAIVSVLQQDFAEFEIIVINDGSEAIYDDAYQALQTEFPNKFKLIHLEPSWRGHGPSFVRNLGALHAKGDYLCFLDDDDIWLNHQHLTIAHQLMTQTHAELYFTTQQAYRNGQPQEARELWLNGLITKLNKIKKPLIDTAYQVNVSELMNQGGFSHLNTTIIKKEFFQQIKGMDENIRYEEDMDFYLRAIDQAKTIIYNPIETARHHIPDKTKSDNMSTLVSDLEKMNYRLTFLNKMLFSAHHVEIIKHAKKHKAYTLKYIAQSLSKQDKHNQAFFYAREALLIGFTIKWQIFTLFLAIKALIKK